MANPGGTAMVDYNSDLVRKRWIVEGLLKFKDKSFWQPYIGRSFNAVIYQATNTNAKEGHTVVFDFDGEIVAGPVKGKQKAFGRGETKKKFSDKITVDRYRFTVDNGDAFDGVNIGDLNITQHQDSRTKLSRKWTRFKDQSYFDTLQQSVTHTIETTGFTFSDLLDVENIIKTGYGYTTGERRLPMRPYETADGRPIWLLIIDSTVKSKLLSDAGTQGILKDADLRGAENRLFKGVLGKVGNFVIIEADSFFGTQTGSILDADDYFAFNNIAELIMPGLRQYDKTNDAWSGEEGFNPASTDLYSRCLIVGAGALQHAWGKMPDYKVQPSSDFGITSESLLEVWTNVKATKLIAENDDYSVAIGGISYGVVGLDVKVS
jgi:hypothetical protein